MDYVIKRDGKRVPFEKQKIVNAIEKSMAETERGVDHNLAIRISNKVSSIEEDMQVEQIQDIVENALMASKRKDAAHEYICYRYLHGLCRDQYKEMMNIIAEKLSGNNVQNQNANVDEHSFGGRIGEATNAVMKQFALDYCVSETTRKNHENNEVYIHDLDRYASGMHNCLSIPFDDLLANGFNTRQTDVRPANSVNTAFQLVAVIFQLQSLQQFGGCSATHLDWTMVPYVRKSFRKHWNDGVKYIEKDNEDFPLFLRNVEENLPITEYPDYEECSDVYSYALDMTIRETRQAVEGMFHNLNTLQSRSGNQLPFTSINYGTCTLEEGRIVTRALLEVAIEGVGKLHKTPVFPCCIFQCMKGVNRAPGDKNYDLFQLALKSTAKRLYPNYANVDWSGNAGYDINDPRTYFSTMGK